MVNIILTKRYHANTLFLIVLQCHDSSQISILSNDTTTPLWSVSYVTCRWSTTYWKEVGFSNARQQIWVFFLKLSQIKILPRIFIGHDELNDCILVSFSRHLSFKRLLQSWSRLPRVWKELTLWSFTGAIQEDFHSPTYDLMKLNSDSG